MEQRDELVQRIRELIAEELAAPGAVRDLVRHAPEIPADTLRELLQEAHPAAIGEAIAEDEEITTEHAAGVLDLLPPYERAMVFAELRRERQVELAAVLGAERLAPIVAEMPHDDRVDFLRELPEAQANQIVSAQSPQDRADIGTLQKYPEGTVGSVMTTEFASIPVGLTIGEALDRVRAQASDRETINYIYLTEPDGRLVGVLSLRELVVNKPSVKVDEVMTTEFVRVHSDQPRGEAAESIRRYDLLAVPVVDAQERLVGIVTFDDVLDVVEEEASEDFHKVGGTGMVKVSLREASTFLLVRKRVPWLLTLVFVNIFSGSAMAAFEDTLMAMIALAFFLPLLIDSGGNAGSQAATLMIRALATGDVKMRNWLGLLGKEVGVSLILGLIMAAGVSLIAAYREPQIIAVVAITMVTIVMVGSLIGMLLPFIFTRFGYDPATASGPLITSLADIRVF